MANPTKYATRRQFMKFGLAAVGAAGGLAGFLALTARETFTPQPTVIERPQFEIVVPKGYRNVETLGDLIGKERVCLIPPNRNDEKAMAEYAAEKEKYRVTTRTSISDNGKEVLYFALYANYPGDKGEVNEGGAHIMGVTDLRCVSGISKPYFEKRAPISHALKYTAATGQMPMHVYITKTAADRLKKSALFRQNMLANFSPDLPATVLPNDSEQAKLLRWEPCKTGIHEFLPKECGERYEFVKPRFIPRR